MEGGLGPSPSGGASTSDSGGRVLCRPAWLEVTLERALLFLTRSESGAEQPRAAAAAVSLWSGSEPTFTNALRVLVKAEVTEPITKRGDTLL